MLKQVQWITLGLMVSVFVASCGSDTEEQADKGKTFTRTFKQRVSYEMMLTIEIANTEKPAKFEPGKNCAQLVQYDQIEDSKVVATELRLDFSNEACPATGAIANVVKTYQVKDMGSKNYQIYKVGSEFAAPGLVGRIVPGASEPEVETLCQLGNAGLTASTKGNCTVSAVAGKLSIQ